MSKFKHIFNPNILRAYDIRGIFNNTLSEKDAFMLGYFFGIICREKNKGKTPNVVLSMDGRISSPKLKEQTAIGLIKSGCNVIDLGLNPTPLLYFGNSILNTDGAIQITGSHNPKDYNGFKMIMNNEPFFGNDIQKLGKRAQKGSDISLNGKIQYKNLDDQYLNQILQPISYSEHLRNRTIVWDCGNGATGLIIKKITEEIPGEHIILYSEIDGNFPNHHPDPSNETNLLQLKKEIKKRNADFGFAFDGDGDRLGLVNSKCQLISGDILSTFLAQSISKKDNPIILDIKSSQSCKDFLEKLNYKVLIWKTGHSHIKKKMKDIGSSFAGEMSGHIFFGDTYYGYDDAIYASIRFLSLIENGIELDNFLSNFKTTFSTPEIKIKCSEEDKFKIVENLKIEIKKKYRLSLLNLIDGIRVDLTKGWYLIRASNTENAIIVRIDGNTKENLVNLFDEVQALLKTENLNINFKMSH